MIDALDVGYAIKDRRAQLGLTQAQVAESAGVSSRCLWSLELGQNPGVQFNKLTAVLDALGLDLRIAARDATPHAAYDASNATACGDGEKEARVGAEARAGAPSPGEPLPRFGAGGGLDALSILTGGGK